MDIIKVGSRGNPYNYLDEAKKSLAANGSTELHALQGGIPNAVKAADLLINLGYAQLLKFETSLIEDGKNNDRFAGTPKVVVRIEKAATFEKASTDFENSRLVKGK